MLEMLRFPCIVLCLTSLSVAGALNATQEEEAEPQRSPLLVNLSVFFLNVHKVDAQTGTISISAFFRMKWNHTEAQEIFPEVNSPARAPLTAKRWQPDLFILEDVHDRAIGSYSSNFFARVENETVVTSNKISPVVFCSMDFRNFPFDDQRCILNIESYGRTADRMLLNWENSSQSDLVGSASAAGFTLSVTSLEVTVSGKYSRATAVLSLKRKATSYVSLFYLPTILYTLLPWMTFFFGRRGFVLQMAAGLYSIAMITLLSLSMHWNLPAVDYVKASDAWVYVCTALVVLILVHNLLAHSAYELDSYAYHETATENGKAHFEMEGPNQGKSLYNSKYEKVLSVFRWTYPIIMIFIIMIYFTTVAL